MTGPPTSAQAGSPLAPTRVVDPSVAAPAARAWRWFIAAGLATTLLVLTIPAGPVSDSLYVLLGLATAAALLAGVLLHRPRPALPWLLMGVAQLLWVGGDISYSWHGVVTGLSGDYPLVGDLLYLSAYPVFAASFLVLIIARRREFEVVALLDSAVVTAGLGLLAWVLLARPLLDAAGDATAASTVITVGYPLGDILLVGGLIRLMATTDGRSVSLRLLLLAGGLLVTADVVNSTLSLYSGGDRAWINGLWLASYVAWGAAALHPSMVQVTQPRTEGDVRFTWVRVTAFGVATLTAPGVLAVEALLDTPLDVWAVVVGSVLMFSLVVLRMSITLRAIADIVRERSALQDELSHRASHDPLTGLPNRARLLHTLEAALHRTRQAESCMGLLFVDLDGFKAVNDTFGHQAGDLVLRVVADRLQQQVRTGDVVARLGGDEFVVLLEPPADVTASLLVAERLVEALARPIDLGRLGSARIGASVGGSVTGDATITPETILHEADTAAYRAKNGGKGRAEVYDSALRDAATSRVTLEDALAAAIENDELVLHYQPVVRVDTLQVAGYEALVRWDRPGHGLVDPDDFIPLAEASHLICELDTWALRRACLDFADVTGGPDGPAPDVAVNISGRHLARPRVVEDVAVALARARLPAGRLVVELTETVLVDDEVAVRHLGALREGGVRVSIDDFGTGYSAISRLGTLPIDTVKIDRRFVDPDSTSAPILLQLMVDAAHAHGLPVVVEGIEYAHQLQTLRRLGCESAQGYLLGRPGPLAEVLARRPSPPAEAAEAAGPGPDGVVSPIAE